MTISVKVILQSRNEQSGDILTTLLLRYPRWIHSELMTHRVFSRNAASSRALPVEKLIEEAQLHPAFPKYWFKNQPGMQGTIPMEPEDAEEALIEWRNSRNDVVKRAKRLAATGAHKQIVNRILEPYVHITTLISATEWENFFALREHRDAEPHFQELATAIREAIDRARTQTLAPREWHLPFSTARINPSREALIHSVACCASTSYKTVDGFDMTAEKAERIFNKLNTEPLHASPLEHIAIADELWNGTFLKFDCHRNYRGFIQLRALIERKEIDL